MPEETRKGVENIKKGEIDKRKKIWEEKEGPPTKKQKKMAAQEEKGASDGRIPRLVLFVEFLLNSENFGSYS